MTLLRRAAIYWGSTAWQTCLMSALCIREYSWKTVMSSSWVCFRWAIPYCVLPSGTTRVPGCIGSVNAVGEREEYDSGDRSAPT